LIGKQFCLQEPLPQRMIGGVLSYLLDFLTYSLSVEELVYIVFSIRVEGDFVSQLLEHPYSAQKVTDVIYCPVFDRPEYTGCFPVDILRDEHPQFELITVADVDTDVLRPERAVSDSLVELLLHLVRDMQNVLAGPQCVFPEVGTRTV